MEAIHLILNISLRKHFLSCAIHENAMFSILKTAQPEC